jgi:hypothetical protein
MQRDLDRLRESIANIDQSRIDRWFAAIDRRCWQIARLPEDRRTQFYERARIALQTLQVALHDATSISLGAPELREPVQHFSFLAGWMAGQRLPIGAAVGLCQGLQEAFGERPLSFYDDLTLVVCEAYASGQDHTAQAQHRQIVQRSQVVCVLANKVVGLFAVADPDREALEEAIGRLMMLTIMRDAAVIVVDASGLVHAEASCEEIIRVMAGHRDALANRKLLFSGVSPELGKHLLEIANAGAGLARDLGENGSRPAIFQIGCYSRVDLALSSLDPDAQ